MTSINGSTASLDHLASITHRQAASPTGANQAFANTNGSTVATDFTQSYDPINSYAQGSTGGSYTVRAGDTLQGIALAVWGDANLWYKIAEANGLSAGSALIDGQSLILPSGITTSGYNASTLRPYDPQDAIGDTSPTAPKPPKKNKCAVVGMLLLAAIAIAVAAIAGPQAIIALKEIGLGAAAAFAGGSVAAATAGSIVSQGVGLATGLQDKFSFKSVALSAVTAGITAGAGGPLTIAAKTAGLPALAATAASAATVSAIGQGVAVATGLQDKFSWAGVAAAGVAAGAGGLFDLKPLSASGSARNIASHIAVGGARLLASAATRSAIEGNSFGDNVMAGLPDVLAQVAVDAVAGGIGRAGMREEQVDARNVAIAQYRKAKAELRQRASTVEEARLAVKADNAKRERIDARMDREEAIRVARMESGQTHFLAEPGATYINPTYQGEMRSVYELMEGRRRLAAANSGVVARTGSDAADYQFYDEAYQRAIAGAKSFDAKVGPSNSVKMVDDRNSFQFWLDDVRSDYRAWDDARVRDYVSANERWDRASSGGVIGWLARRQDNAVFGITRPLFYLPDAAMYAISHPMQTGENIVLAVPRAGDWLIEADQTPALTYFGRARDTIANNSTTENSILLGEVVGFLAPTGRAKLINALDNRAPRIAAEGTRPPVMDLPPVD